MRVTDSNRIVWRESLPRAIAMLNGQGGYLSDSEGDGYRWLEWLCQQILPEPVGFLEWNEKSRRMEIRPGKEKVLHVFLGKSQQRKDCKKSTDDF